MDVSRIVPFGGCKLSICRANAQIESILCLTCDQWGLLVIAISNKSPFARWEGYSRVVHDSFSIPRRMSEHVKRRRRFLESLEYLPMDQVTVSIHTRLFS